MPRLQNFLLIRRELHRKCLQRGCFSSSLTKMLTLRLCGEKTIKQVFSMFYTLTKHGFLTNQGARRVLSILESSFKGTIHVRSCKSCYMTRVDTVEVYQYNSFPTVFVSNAVAPRTSTYGRYIHAKLSRKCFYNRCNLV